jgi:hypothetical protein
MRLLTGILFVAFIASCPEWQTVAQPVSAPQAGCSVLNKDHPLLFISFERVDDKAWNGDKYVKGALLRVRNNSNCAILLEAPPGEASSFRIRDGKLTRLEMEEAKDGQRVSLKYLMKYPDQAFMVVGGFGGDVLDYVRLNGGDSILFSVPLSNFRKRGELLLPFNYEWDMGAGSEVVINEGGAKYRHAAVEHHLRFGPGLLPGELLR